MLRIRKTLPVRHHQDRVRRVVASGEVTWGGKSNRVNELSHDGGTQTNATVSDAMLKSYQGVIAASTGHISVHEAGAIEFGGHKVLTLPHHNGKIRADQIRTLLDEYQHDANHDHMVMPGMVYLSHPADPLSKWLCALLRFPDESGLLCHRERRDGTAGKAGGIRLLGSV